MYNYNLEQFRKHGKEIESLFAVKRNDFDGIWISTKVNIANSAIYIYKFTNELFEREKVSKEYIRYYSFYIDLIMSKLRYSIFTETPKKSIFDPFVLAIDEIIDVAYDLINDKYNSFEDFHIDFNRFLFKVFIFYDFIFYENEGIFTRFKLDPKIFEKVHMIMLENEDTSFREYGSNIMVNYIHEILKYNKIETENNSELATLCSKLTSRKCLK